MFTNRIAPGIALVAACVAATIVSAQDVGSTPREAPGRASVDQPAAPAQPPTGGGASKDELKDWGHLIVGGELIAAPYEVVAKDGQVVVNGRVVRGAEQPAVTIAPSASAEAQHEMLTRFWKAYRGWLKREGVAAAKEKGLEMLREQPLIESAELGDGTIKIRFKGDADFEHLEVDDVEPVERQPSAEVRKQAWAEDQARAIRYWLENGSLVIIDDHVLIATPPALGHQTFDKLQAAVAGSAELGARADAVRALISDKEASRRIAERFRAQ